MNAQDIIDLSRINHLRELKTVIEKLKTENAKLREINAELTAHFDLAILAARELESLAADAKMLIVDGWNLILGAKRCANNCDELIGQAQAHLEEHPNDLVWLVLDGPKFHVQNEGRLRITYTGGTGAHRADRFICDFLRMAKFRGTLEKIEVRTNDKDFLKEVERLRRE